MFSNEWESKKRDWLKKRSLNEEINDRELLFRRRGDNFQALSVMLWKVQGVKFGKLNGKFEEITWENGVCLPEESNINLLFLVVEIRLGKEMKRKKEDSNERWKEEGEKRGRKRKERRKE